MPLEDEKTAEIFKMVAKEKEEIENKENDSPKDISSIFSKSNEITNANGNLPQKDETDIIIDKLHKGAIINQVQNDDETKQKFIDQAKSTVEAKLENINQQNIKQVQDSTYNANEEACNNYGVNKAVPLWQIKLMKAGSAFWFVIYFIFSSFTIAPISVFFKGFRTFLKNTWVAIIVAVLCYGIIAIGLPLLIKWLSEINQV